MQPIRVPLAEDCYSTFYLQRKGLRLESYFFDWIIISPESCLNLFKTEFKGYLEKENLISLGPGGTEFKKAEIAVRDLATNIVYLHHFNSIEEDWASLKSKFDRKIERLEKHFRANRRIELYYTARRADWIMPEIPTRWGRAEMERVFPELRLLLLQRYGYCNETDITLIQV